MKKDYFIIFIALCCFSLNAQLDIPDSNFENYLETHNANGDVVTIGDASSMGDGVLNNLTLISKVEGVTELYVSENNIASLQGIEAFTNLEILHCRANQLEVLDISQNLALVELECESNQFSTLDVSNNLALKVLGFGSNNLSSIDVSNNLLLEAIWFVNNNISSLNLDVNTALRTYGLSNNPLVYMSIQNGNNTNVQYIEALNLPSLSCIQVDNATAATYLSTNFSFVDEGISFSEDCGTVYIPDNNFENYLETHNANGDIVPLGDATSMGDGVLNNLTLISKVEGVINLNVNDSNIANLQGLEAFTNLESLYCQRNQLENLDVSQNLNLSVLECESNLFTSLDVSNNTVLRTLGCALNNLSSLDVSNNLLLEGIWFTDNNIVSLNLDVNTALNVYGLSNNPLVYMSIKNGNNANVVYMEAQNLPTLSCIQVDDANAASYLSSNFSFVDEGISFSEDCGDLWTVYTSDANVDAALSSYGSTIDTSGDGEITLNEAAAYTGTLDLSGQDITDIEGLQAFTSVTEINLSGNNISDLSVLFGSNAVVLTNKQAEFKTVASSSFSALLVLDVSYNSLTSIDVSEITTLVELNCSNNLLNSLNIKNGNNAILTTFEASNNTALSCIQVDNVADASSGLGSYSAWNKDTFAIYSEDCSSALSTVDNNLIPSLSIFPNPVKDVITVNAKQAIENITIYNIMGQKVNSFETLKNNQIDVSGYPKGFYIMSAEINGAIQSLKFLKE
jgi:Leucine-rich repeat (LRR) protein